MKLRTYTGKEITKDQIRFALLDPHDGEVRDCDSNYTIEFQTGMDEFEYVIFDGLTELLRYQQSWEHTAIKDFIALCLRQKYGYVISKESN